MSILAQRSLAGGEIAPALYARTDMAKYASGLRTCRNAVVMRHGGAQNRAGFKFVAEVKDSSKTVRLIPFVFNDLQTYVLEFGDLYMRVHKAGVQLTLASQNISGITAANPAVLTYAGSDTYANGDEVYISGVAGDLGAYVNGRSFKVVNLNAGANTFELDYLDGTNVNSSTWPAYTSGGTVAEVYEITTPYAYTDLDELQFVQSADVITLAHPSHAPRNLSRTADTSWTLALVDIEPDISRPTNLARSAYAAGNYTYKYKVTARNVSGEESLPGTIAAQDITGVTQANPAVVTYVGTDNFENGDEVLIEGVAGMTELNGNLYIVANVNAGANTFQLLGVDSTGYTAYSASGTVRKTSITMTAAAVPVVTSRHDINWTAVSGAVEYVVYCDPNQSGVFGFIGTTNIPEFRNEGITPDTTLTPPTYKNPFDGAGNYPGAVSYFQQRRIYGGSTNDPEKVWGSRTGQFNNFNVSTPSRDDDAVSFVLASRQVNQIRHMLDLGKLLILTSGGEWASGAEVLTPSDIQARQHGYNGSATLPPVVIGSNALYLQARGSVVRDLAYDFSVDGYQGNDLTVFAGHLFRGHTIEDWTYAQNPDSVLWAVRNDGVLLGLTYVREHQVWGWHRHDTDGLFENVCAVPEGEEDVLYAVVKRTIDGATVRYVERMQTRFISDIEDAIFMDAALTYDGTQVGSVSMTLSGGTTWARGETLVLTASGGGTFVDGTGATRTTFEPGDVGNQIHITYGGAVYRCTITAWNSTTVVDVRVERDVPAGLRGVAQTTWGKAVDELTGLWHLEGEDVSVFADGFVVANPNNEGYDGLTVASGALTLPRPFVVIHVGLPYTTDIQTLDIDTAQGQPLVDKKKLITKVTLGVEDTRGLWAGAYEPDDDTVGSDNGLFEQMQERSSYDEVPPLATEPIEISVTGEWNSNGRVFIRQSDPVPMTILSINPGGVLPQ